MRFALIDGQRQEAQPGLSGECPGCGRPVVAKCGEVRVRHWAHKGHQLCDPWWENETEWHRTWKDQFPTDWQEIVHAAADGERHIADVKTDRGWVLEFQHSYIKPEERRSRESFYPKLIWVVDGVRRKRDPAQLFEAWKHGVAVGGPSLIRKVYVDECALLRDWAGSGIPVFFDLGEPNMLWWLFAKVADAWAYVTPFSRAEFLGSHCSTELGKGQEFDDFVNDIPKIVAAFESRPQAQPTGWSQFRARAYRRPFRF